MLWKEKLVILKTTTDKHAGYKLVFMKIANDYINNTSAEQRPEKQKKLQSLVLDTLQRDPVLLTWFNTMFKWSNTEHGVDIQYKIQPPQIP
jgi:hypothetical protein